MTGNDTNTKGTTMSAKYRVGQKMKLPYTDRTSGETSICAATIVGMYRPGNKKNSHMYRVHIYTPKGGMLEAHYETADITYMTKHVESIQSC